MTSNLFALMLNSSNDIEFTVRVSFLEIYNEKIQDLLDRKYFILFLGLGLQCGKKKKIQEMIYCPFFEQNVAKNGAVVNSITKLI